MNLAAFQAELSVDQLSYQNHKSMTASHTSDAKVAAVRNMQDSAVHSDDRVLVVGYVCSGTQLL